MLREQTEPLHALEYLVEYRYSSTYARILMNALEHIRTLIHFIFALFTYMSIGTCEYIELLFLHS